MCAGKSRGKLHKPVWYVPALLLGMLFVSTGVQSAELFRDDFESGLGKWNVGAPADIITDTENQGSHYLRLGNGAIVANNFVLPSEFTLTARVRYSPKTSVLEIPFLINMQNDIRSVQIWLDGFNGNVAVGLWDSRGYNTVTAYPIPGLPRVGEWVKFRMVSSQGCLGIWVNDQPAILTRNPLPEPGKFGLREGSGQSDFDDIAISTPTDEEKRFPGLRTLPDAAPVAVKEEKSIALGGGAITIEHDDLTTPLKPVLLHVSTPAKQLSVDVVSPEGKIVLTRNLSGKSSDSLPINGRLGNYTLVWRVGAKEAARTHVLLAAHAEIETSDPSYAECFSRLKEYVEADAQVFRVGDRVVTGNPAISLDGTQELKVCKWWKPEISSFTDLQIRLQTKRGFFFEFLCYLSHDTFRCVTPEFMYKNEADGIGMTRSEVNANTEFLVTDAAYTIWQATGDNEGMRNRLPALERGLRYCLEDPSRWDADHGLMKRPFSIDTWDYYWGADYFTRYIVPSTPMAIMHGDNSGLYRACMQIAEMRDALHLDGSEWRGRAEQIRNRADALLWNGSFYIHEYKLTPVETGADESKMLSLSNVYDINRGLPSHEMAVRIIDEYQKRRALNPGDFAEWYALDPPYPNFSGTAAGSYVNGSVAPFVAGELACAAFTHGREEYGADVLRRVLDVAKQRGFLPFFMDRKSGADTGGGPRGWGSAAVMSAMLEGLAGITDRSVLYRDVEVAPRYPAAGITGARACVRYGPSDAYVATKYYHDAKTRRIMMQVAGSPAKIHFHILMPKNATPRSLRVGGEPAKFSIATVEESRYCDFDVTRDNSHETELLLQYE